MAKKKKSKDSPFRGKVAKNSRRTADSGQGYGYLNIPKDIPVYEEEEGGRMFDLVPYIVSDPHHPDHDEDGTANKGTQWYRRPFKIHRNIGVDNDRIICPRSIGKPCPICEHIAKRRKAGADKDELKPIRPSDRCLYIPIPRGSKKFDPVPHLWDISKFGFQEALDDELKENEDWEVFPSLSEGFTIKARFKTEKIGQNDFIQCTRVDFVDRKKEIDEDVLDEVPDLDECLRVLSYKELKAKFFEDPDAEEDEDSTKEDSDDDLEDDQPSKRKRKKPSKDEEDDDGEEDSDEDEDSEEEETPRRKKKKAAAKKKRESNDDEDSEEEDGEDDEEETPVRRRKPTGKKKRSEPEDDDEGANDDEEEEETPRRRKKKSSGSDPEECPYDHRFGKDNDKFPKDCDKCKKWDACYDASQDED